MFPFASWLRKTFFRPFKASRASRGKRSATRSLWLEALEDRTVFAASLTAAAYGQVPLAFEANQGQVDPRVDFLSRGPGYSLFLTPTQSVLSLVKPGNNGSGPVSGDVLSMSLVGGNANPLVQGLDKQASVTNYLIGDPSQWVTNVANYGEIQYLNVYAGVNEIYHGNQQSLEYDFVVAPGADPGVIRMSFQGQQGLSLDAQGNLVLQTSGGDVIEQAPVMYQILNGVRQSVSGGYVLEADGAVGFAVGDLRPDSGARHRSDARLLDLPRR